MNVFCCRRHGWQYPGRELSCSARVCACAYVCLCVFTRSNVSCKSHQEKRCSKYSRPAASRRPSKGSEGAAAATLARPAAQGGACVCMRISGCKMDVIAQIKGGMREEGNGPTGSPGSPLPTISSPGRPSRAGSRAEGSKKTTKGERKRQTIPPARKLQDNEGGRCRQSRLERRGGEERDRRKQDRQAHAKRKTL